ncbi:uncharacterized protein LOC128250513 [Octopus bimaculoides]|uniref:uncharacterized protein LOC128250513 n=1 Tax=Octopus bimaculoides TaxID=37653 RepID=UPI0022E8FACC|nr:uncharacterized protein LOC128250513 [Octopus bimaculoides]
MKGISVLLFSVFISYTLSVKQDVAPFHQRIGDYVSLSNMTHSNKFKRNKPNPKCNELFCDGSGRPTSFRCCPGLKCVCRILLKCRCSSKDTIHMAHNGIHQTVIAFLIFIVNLPSY